MIINEYNNISIGSIACAVSTKWVSIESQKNGENDAILDKFVKTTSVLGHYEAGARQTAADLSCVAARTILEKYKINRDSIGVLVFVSQYPDYKVPSTSCVLQNRLGLSKDCSAFDVNLGCSGYVYGLNIVASLMATSNIKYGLLLAGDTSTKGIRQDNSKNLFGDAGTATLLIKDENAVPMSFSCRTDGAGFKAILRPYGCSKHPERPDVEGFSDELGVFNFAIEQAPLLINDFMTVKGTTPDDYHCLALHQANMMIMKQIVKKTHFSKEKMLVSLDRFANTSSASIPLSIIKAYGEESNDTQMRSLISGYGIGLSWGVGDIVFNVKDILPLIETDEYYDDGLFE